jgi:hypothetical protein
MCKVVEVRDGTLIVNETMSDNCIVIQSCCLTRWLLPVDSVSILLPASARYGLVIRGVSSPILLCPSFTDRDDNTPCTHPLNSMQRTWDFTSSAPAHGRRHETRTKRILPSSKLLRRFARLKSLVVAERLRRKRAKVMEASYFDSSRGVRGSKQHHVLVCSLSGRILRFPSFLTQNYPFC